MLERLSLVFFLIKVNRSAVSLYTFISKHIITKTTNTNHSTASNQPHKESDYYKTNHNTIKAAEMRL